MQRKPVNFSHAENNEAFSSHWGELFEDAANYPRWIEMCNSIELFFKEKNYHAIPLELSLTFGFLRTSKIVDTSSSAYSQFGTGQDTADVVKLSPEQKKKQLAEEIRIWTLKNLRKLLNEYIEYRLQDPCDLFSAKDVELLAAFVDELIELFINPAADFLHHSYLRISANDTNRIKFAEDLFEDFTALKLTSELIRSIRAKELKLLGRTEWRKKTELNQDDLEVIALHIKQLKLKIKNTDSDVRVHSRTMPAHYLAGINDKLDQEFSRLQEKYPAAAPQKRVTESTPIIPISHQESVRNTKNNVRTIAFIALGALAALLLLGVVIVASHGTVLPLLAGIGAGMALGHVGSSLGLAIGVTTLVGITGIFGGLGGYLTKRSSEYYFKSAVPRPQHLAADKVEASSTCVLKSALHSSMPSLSENKSSGIDSQITAGISAPNISDTTIEKSRSANTSAGTSLSTLFGRHSSPSLSPSNSTVMIDRSSSPTLSCARAAGSEL